MNGVFVYRHRRAVAVAVCAALMAGVGIGSVAGSADAEESELPAGLELPVPAQVVSTSDNRLETTSNEVVAVVTSDGAPQVVKLRAANQTAALRLAHELDSQPGVTATMNQTRRLAETADGEGRGSKSMAGDKRVAASVGALSAETLGRIQWGLTAVNAEQAWKTTRGDQRLIVGVIDTGVDATHPDLSGRILPQIDLLNEGQTGDLNGHGTHVSGIITAALNGTGVAGLANKVSVLPVRVFNADGWTDFYSTAAGIIAAVDAGAKVINLSYGGAHSDVEARAVEYAVNKGVTVVAAGGNEYLNGNPTTYPAALPGVLGVASLSPDYRSSDFSNAGPYIDLAAPGEDIMSTIPGADWDLASGTSAAAPFVAASAALVRVANPTLTKPQVDDILTSTARDDSSGDGRDWEFGWGLLQADKAAAKAAKATGGIASPQATVKAKAVSGSSKLSVDVNPDKGSGYWTFQVQQRKPNGTWTTLPATYKTAGKAEQLTINLPKGTYRAVVAAKYGYRGNTSSQVTLKK